jgi:hypothetical protein
MEQPVIIFAHIPKAAGTTLHRIIEQQYHRQDIYSIYPTPRNPEGGFSQFVNLPPEQRAQIRIMKGHLLFGLHAYLPGPFTYFTLLREPIDRVISFYYYVRQNAQHYLHQHVLAQNMSLRQYIESQATTANDNFQVRMLAGAQGIAFGQCTRGMLDEAKFNLQEYFSVAGLSEHFDATLLMLKHAFQWRSVYYVRQNVNVRRPALATVPPDTLDLIREQNWLDIELYQYVKQLFEDRLKNAGSKFTEELTTFRAENQRRQPLLRIDWKVREQIRRSQDLALMSQSTHHVPLPLLQTYWLLRQVSLRAWLRPNTSK